MVASKIAGIGRKTLIELSLDRLFYEIPLAELSLSLSEFRSFTVGSSVYERAISAADKDVEKAMQLGHSIISLCDSSYPSLLSKLNDKPAILFISGNLAKISEKALAVIGTREPSDHGRIVAERITKYFSLNGWQIVSGLALGIDSVAHEATLSVSGSTVAVLAHGLETVYPKKNQRLADEIVAGGGVLISEYSYGTPSFPGNFVERDRIQAGLARGVVMVQSDEMGGSWHASRAALQYNRYLFVPSPTSADLKANHPKINGNRKVLEVTSNKLATFLKCEINDLERLVVINSRDDYPQLEKLLDSLIS